MKEGTYQTLVALIEKHYWAPKDGFSKTTTIADDLGIDGPDGIELMQLVATEFDLQMDDFNWVKYFTPDGCNPFILLLRPWRHKMSQRWIEFFQFDLFCGKAPLTLQHICECIGAGRWFDDPQLQVERIETESGPRK